MSKGCCCFLYSQFMVQFEFCGHESLHSCLVEPGSSLKVISSFPHTREEMPSEGVFHGMLKLKLSNLSDFKVDLVPEFFQCGKAQATHSGLDVVEQKKV